jgi:hypothetical protein
MAQDAWLRDMTDQELAVLASEVEEREADPKTRQLVNDELRRRKLPPLHPSRRWA